MSNHEHDDAAGKVPDPVEADKGQNFFVPPVGSTTTPIYAIPVGRPATPTPTIMQKINAINRKHGMVDVCGLQCYSGAILCFIDLGQFEIIAAECLAEEENARIADGEAREEERAEAIAENEALWADPNKVNVDEKPEAEDDHN